ncbi:hypothetical protein V3472_12285 [Lacticaseibacillus rhamnosus]
MTTDEQWLIETAAQHQKDAASYENAAFLRLYRRLSPSKLSAVNNMKPKLMGAVGIMSSGKVQSDDGGTLQNDMLCFN